MAGAVENLSVRIFNFKTSKPRKNYHKIHKLQLSTFET